MNTVPINIARIAANKDDFDLAVLRYRQQGSTDEQAYQRAVDSVLEHIHDWKPHWSSATSMKVQRSKEASKKKGKRKK